MKNNGKKLLTSLWIYAEGILQKFRCKNSVSETVSDVLEDPQEITFLFTDFWYQLEKDTINSSHQKDDIVFFSVKD